MVRMGPTHEELVDELWYLVFTGEEDFNDWEKTFIKNMRQILREELREFSQKERNRIDDLARDYGLL